MSETNPNFVPPPDEWEDEAVTVQGSLSQASFAGKAVLMRALGDAPVGFRLPIGEVRGIVRELSSAQSKFANPDGSPRVQHVFKGTFEGRRVLPGCENDPPIVAGSCFLPGGYPDMVAGAFRAMRPGEELQIAARIIAVRTASENALPWKYDVEALFTRRDNPLRKLRQAIPDGVMARRLPSPSAGSAADVIEGVALPIAEPEKKKSR